MTSRILNDASVEPTFASARIIAGESATDSCQVGESGNSIATFGHPHCSFLRILGPS